MATTLGNVLTKVRGVLGDPGGADPLYADELITDGVLEALKAILPWVSKESTQTYTGDGTTFEFALPDDCAEVEAVLSTLAHEFLPKAGLFPTAPWYHGEGSALDQNSWLDYPHGKITLSAAPQSAEDILVLYAAYWIEPAIAADELEVPAYALPGIIYYTAAYCLSPKATSAANVRQYNTKVDSGLPIHNPMVDIAKYFLMRFETEMSRCPLRTRGQKTR